MMSVLQGLGSVGMVHGAARLAVFGCETLGGDLLIGATAPYSAMADPNVLLPGCRDPHSSLV